MPSSKFTYNFSQEPQSSVVREDTIETAFIGNLLSLRYDYRQDITDRATLEQNFREKFESLNRVRLTDGEFAHLLGAANHPLVRKPAEIDGGSGAGQTTALLGNLRRGELSGSPSRMLQRRPIARDRLTKS